MNPIDQLRAARPAHLDDTPVDPRTRAAELSRAMARPRPAPARRRIVRPVWGLGLAGAAAAVTAVAVVISATGGTAPRAPSVQVISSPATTTPRIELAGRSILLAAAHGAARQPDVTGAYWHTVSVSRNLFEAADGDYTLVDRQRNEVWTPSATGGEQWSRTRSLGVEPASPDDRAAWERAGSPTEIQVRSPKGGDNPKSEGFALSTEPGAAQDGHAPLVDGDKVFWLGRNVSMKDLRGLPEDPEGLKAWLLRSYEGHDTESDTPMSSDAWLFAVTVGLITDMPVTPQVRGAAFRMLADLETIEVVRDVVDAEGRTGSAVAIEERARAKADAKGGEGILRNRLIFDEATGRALARDSVVVRPGGLQAGFAPGTVWNSETVLAAGWTDERPAS
ncbi:CU044_5270 family protein [Streptosporangium amethystogenes subsp. fukuiense]|uniref:CU044_5270 family protein n=1 Tax=Streptosporangium amethystogenes subsp. fukuiense TaxID=698418 RepID=A0ABW2TA56_9ACTN